MDTTMKIVVAAAVFLFVGLGVSYIFNDQFGLFADTADSNTQDSSCRLLLAQGNADEAENQGCDVCTNGGTLQTGSDPGPEGQCCEIDAGSPVGCYPPTS